MANPLLSVPGLGGYVAQRQMNEQGALGQLQQAQAVLGLQGLMEKRAQEGAFRSALSGLGPNPSQEQLAQLSSRFVTDPGKLLDIQQKSLDRQTMAEERAFQFANNLQLRRDSLDQQKELALSRAQDKASQDAINNQFKDRQLVLDQQQKQFQQWATKEGLDLKRILADSKSKEKESADIERQIQKTQTAMKDVQPMMTAAHQLNDILSQYTPQDVPGLGYLKNTELGKVALTGEGKNVASSVKLLGSAILKAMSGAAVTPSEEIRQMAAQMADGRFSAQDFYIAWPKISKWVGDQGALGTASLSGPAKERFVERTGLNLDPIKPRFTFDGKALVDTYAPKTGEAIPPPPPGFEVNK